jgi:hypothetical protein
MDQKECISTPMTSVLVNCSPTDEFLLERGLRQGDPLFPFLFLLAAEECHVMMKSIVESNVYTRYLVGDHDYVVIPHLKFANDTFLFTIKIWATDKALLAVLYLFEAMSGLKGNFHKSMLVGVNVNDSWLNEVALVLKCKIGKIPFVYLGMSISGNVRRLIFWE